MPNLPIKVDAKLDINKTLESTGRTGNVLLAMLLGERYIRRCRQAKLSLAQIAVEEAQILNNNAMFDSESKSLTILAKDHIESAEVENILHCAKHAIPLIQEQEDNTEIGDIDFINRWRDAARLLSKEAVRELWGKVLAQEINSPNSISLRTLDTIKNLSKSEAESFLIIAKYVLYGSVVIDNKQDFLHKHFIACRDSGLLINYTPGLYRSTTWAESPLSSSVNESTPVFYIRAHDYFLYIKKTPDFTDKAPNFSYWELSESGKELYKIVSNDLKIKNQDLGEILKCLNEELISQVFYTKYSDIEQNKVDLDKTQRFINDG